MTMSLTEWIVWFIVLCALAMAIGFLAIYIPNTIKNIPPKRHSFKKPASLDYKKTVNIPTQDGDYGSSVDKANALNTFDN